MPFGLANAPSVFQSFMHDIFREYMDKFLIVYLDDILVFSDDWESHVKQVRMVFQVLRANSLFVKGSKCLFGVQKVSFLGFIFSPSTIEMDPVKVQAIYDWTQPTSLKSLQKFLGFANFYRRFICNFSSFAKPLTDLTKKGADVVNWSSAAVEAFQELKCRFSSAPVLCQPDVSLPFQVEVDASEIGAGAVLSQRSSDCSVMKPCAFFSRKFSPAERNYDVGNRELLAMKWAFEEWRHWLEGAKHRVVVLTDHKNLTYLESAKLLNPRQARWSLFFSRFDFVVSYLPGSKNVKADALSRSFVPDSPGLSEPAGILKEGTNSQTERTNQTLKTYLRCFVSADQDDWVSFLPLAEFALNNRASSATLVSPFFCNSGFHPRFSPGQVESSDCPGVDTVVDRLQQIWTHVVDNLTLSQEKAQRFANRRHCVGPRLRVGDLVWLSSRHIPMKVSSPKFKPRFIGPYRISEVLNPVSFRLTLPDSFSIHNVFHRSLLRRYVAPMVPSVDPPAPVLVEGELEYIVEKILDSRVSRRKLQYLVKWKGYGQEDNSWVFASDVHAADLVCAFHMAHPGRPGGSGQKLFSCHVCTNSFSTKGSLKVHMRLHTGAKPFKCPHCDMRFRTSGRRKTHIQCHYKSDAKKIRKPVVRRHLAQNSASVPGTTSSTVDSLQSINLLNSSATDPSVFITNSSVLSGQFEQSLLQQGLVGQAILPASVSAGGDLTVSLSDCSLATLEGIQLQLAANLVGQNVQISGIDATGINNITLQVSDLIDPSILQQTLQHGSIIPQTLTGDPTSVQAGSSLQSGDNAVPANVVLQPIASLSLQPATTSSSSLTIAPITEQEAVLSTTSAKAEENV
ncbi:unnamed protein product [Ranitomeya imitator]|uniref:ribonuclease H n=1 Tax=Ranitomeya imitator TaxID=111125 RepID=A0ABN9LTS2_9NEOB|nr:unnamed protein product [Ranitomeya imitator]